MSREAPWIALSVDWADSDMFADATDGERLAWICLLCEAKRSGRGGRLAFRKSALQRHYNLSERSVVGMIERAQKCGAVKIDGDILTLCNWKVYQHRIWDKERRNYSDLPETPEMLTTSTRTNNPPPITNTAKAAGAAVRVKPSAPRPPDPIWDTIMELWPSQSLTDSERGRRNKVVSELKKASATPDEIRARYKVMRRQYQNDPAKCTPMALASRWSEFAKPATVTPSRAGGAPPPLSDEYRTSPASGLTPEQKREILQQATSEVRK